jgi:acetoin utilization deacetylase AcuC-like enzyme
MKIITHPSCMDYHRPGHPERPQRILATIKKLKTQSELPIEWAEPMSAKDLSILRAHTKNLLSQLPQGFDFDADTPSHPHIAEHARRSVGGALSTFHAAMKGEFAFSLLRPPGHHAERDRAMGFCYLNQVAIASLEALENGFKKVAVFDFDVHHGNGTEDIFLNRPGCAFFSIHQSPCYPGTGTESRSNCHNYPVPPRTPRKEYRATFSRAFEDLKTWKPDIVGISAGFDAYARDPLSEETLEMEDFHWLGKNIRNLSIPTFSVLEGGYSDDLPELILAYLKGLNGL